MDKRAAACNAICGEGVAVAAGVAENQLPETLAMKLLLRVQKEKKRGGKREVSHLSLPPPPSRY